MAEATHNNAEKRELWDSRLRWALISALALLVLVLPVRSTTTIRDTLIIVAAILWAARLKLRGRELLRPSGLELGFVLFTLCVLVSLPFSINLSVSLKELRGELLKNILLFYIVFCNVRKEKEAGVVIRALVLGSLVFAVGTIAVYVINVRGPVMEAWGQRPLSYIVKHVLIVVRSGGLRDSGGEVAGLYHSLYIAYLGGFLLMWEKRLPRWLVISALALNMAAILVTFSRAAWLALFVQVIILAHVFRGRRGLVVVLIPLAVGGVVLFKSGFLIRVGEHIDTARLKEIPRLSPKEVESVFTRGSSLGHRMGCLKYNLDIVLKNPFKPHGFGRDLDRKNDRENPFMPRYTDPHNSFVGLAYQLGVQGLLAFVYLIYALLKRLRPGEDAAGWSRGVALVTQVMVAGFMVNIFFGSFLGDDQALMFWLLNAVGLRAAGGFAP